jgi:hypothetical protein
MTHAPLPVSGYTTQSDLAVALVNHNKVVEEQVLRLIDSLLTTQNTDARWLAVGRTHIEQGFMAINRAVFQPKRLEGDI